MAPCRVTPNDQWTQEGIQSYLAIWNIQLQMQAHIVRVFENTEAAANPESALLQDSLWYLNWFEAVGRPSVCVGAKLQRRLRCDPRETRTSMYKNSTSGTKCICVPKPVTFNKKGSWGNMEIAQQAIVSSENSLSLREYWLGPFLSRWDFRADKHN